MLQGRQNVTLSTLLHRKRNDCGIAPVVALHARFGFVFINIFYLSVILLESLGLLNTLGKIAR